MCTLHVHFKLIWSVICSFSSPIVDKSDLEKQKATLEKGINRAKNMAKVKRKQRPSARQEYEDELVKAVERPGI